MTEKTIDPRLDIARTNVRMAVAMRRTNYADTARSAGLSRNAVSQFVSGKSSLSYANMLRVCDVLEIPIAVLHRPDSINESRIRLYKLLERVPDHLAARVIQEVQSQGFDR